jgi:hypothetical protein
LKQESEKTPEHRCHQLSGASAPPGCVVQNKIHHIFGFQTFQINFSARKTLDQKSPRDLQIHFAGGWKKTAFLKEEILVVEPEKVNVTAV